MSKKKNKNKKPLKEGITEINDICMHGIELWGHIMSEGFGFAQKTKEEQSDFWSSPVGVGWI